MKKAGFITLVQKSAAGDLSPQAEKWLFELLEHLEKEKGARMVKKMRNSHLFLPQKYRWQQLFIHGKRLLPGNPKRALQ